MGSLHRDLANAESAFRRGDLGRAERLLKRALSAQPSNSRANELMAYVVGNRGDSDGVFEFLSRATRLPQASATSWYYLGVWLQGKGRFAEALGAFAKSIEIDGGFFPALHDSGRTHFSLGQLPEALRAYERAIALNRASFEVFHNQGRALHALFRYEEALTSYEKALALNPDNAATWFNRGEVLGDLKRYGESLQSYDTALRLKPDFVDVHWNESLTRLLLGQFEQGWEKYEFRWKGEKAWQRRHTEIAPLPRNQPVEGKRVLVWWEQGLGDTLQFCRYAPLLAQRGAQVVLEVQPPLKDLVATVGQCTVIASGEAIPPCDYQIPLLSLPREFATALETIPARTPYLFADPSRARHWKDRLEISSRRMRIAIACSGHARQKDDGNRSVALREFAPLREVADLILVQPEIRGDDASYLAEPGVAILHPAGEIADFQDSAAILANVDMVITIDTSLAHLAGAMGKVVWIVLPWTPTWRWLVDRTESPWYPTATLFRQQERGDWKSVMARVRHALDRHVSARAER